MKFKKKINNKIINNKIYFLIIEWEIIRSIDYISAQLNTVAKIQWPVNSL